MSKKTTNRKSISTIRIGKGQETPFYIKTKKKIERFQALKDGEKDKEDEHLGDWMYLNSKIRKQYKKWFKRHWRKKKKLAPHLFDGDTSNVERFIKNKIPNIPTSLLYKFERFVINPAHCPCCTNDNAPQALELGAWKSVYSNDEVDQFLKEERG
jgi:hypothetical protein